jgi:hypothetical protein
MIPGNRPEDIAWEAAEESVKEHEVLEACMEARKSCPKAQWRFGASDYVFDGCSARVVSASDEVQMGTDWSECTQWTKVVEAWLVQNA